MHPDYPGLFRVTNERKEGEKIGIFADKELDWHSNGNGRKSGTEACVMLYCLKPGENSVTSFCDTRQAYNDLSKEDRHYYDNIDCNFKFENNTFYKLEEDDKRYYISLFWLLNCSNERDILFSQSSTGLATTCCEQVLQRAMRSK